jgi:hypothetical protein
MVFDNDICKFKKLYDNPNNIKYDIICTTFFKMGKHYKNFQIYMNGLARWVKNLRELKLPYKFRLFIDQNVYEDKKIMDLLNKIKDIVQLVIFTCADYMKDNYHIDVFGALVRYFPLFDFENNDSNKVIITDMDLHEDDMIKLINFIKYDTPIMCATAQFSRLFSGYSKLYVISNLMYFNNIKFDNNILINFIKKIAPTLENKGNYNKRLTPFGFGTDEIFINDYLFPHIKYFYINTLYTINFVIYWNKEFIIKNKNSFSRFKYILGKYFNEKYKLDDMINFIDKHFYNIFHKTDVNNYISRRFYKIIKYLHMKNKYILPKELTIYIIKNVDNIIICNLNMKIDNTGDKMRIDKSYVDEMIFKPIYVN